MRHQLPDVTASLPLLTPSFTSLPVRLPRRNLLRPLLWTSLLLAGSALAEVTPAVYFQDHAVLQTGKPVPVWGMAAPAEKVTVTFGGQTLVTAADADGKWRVTLTPLKMSTTPATLTIKGDNTIVLNDILVGEVWLCSGQSNMEFLVRQATNAEAEIAAGDHPLIRHMLVSKRLANTPQNSVPAKWAVASPATVGMFSAVGYYFARDISDKLHVPVGLIHPSWGGSNIVSWMTPAISDNSEFKFVADAWQKKLDNYPAAQARANAVYAEEISKEVEAKTRGETYNKRPLRLEPNPDGSPHYAKPTNMYNAMVAPFTPAALAGVLWYQGEANTGRPEEYRQLFPQMIKEWRAAFGQPELPFLWVQLPNFKGEQPHDDWALLREAQDMALSLPKTGQAVTIDIGEVDNIHPKNKQDVGHRLALIALHDVYGQKVVKSGPRMTEVTYQGDFASVHFSDADGGLVYKQGPVSGFEMAGADKKYKPVEAFVKGDAVILHAPDVSAPVAVRYAWKNAPQVTVFNQNGLPAAPFRTDKW